MIPPGLTAFRQRLFRGLTSNRPWGVLLITAGIGLFSPAFNYGATLQDFFTNRETATSISGTIIGNNASATVEIGEPEHGGKPGGHSVWVSWVAPSDGVATFDTHGSSFDTTMSAYYFGSTNDTALSQLHEAARSDDDPTAPPTSMVQFGALAGHSYQIAVDGYSGATGNIVLNWSFNSVGSPPPVILSTPNDRSAKFGDTVTLKVSMTVTPAMQLKWYFYDNEVFGEDGLNTPDLTITNLQPANVGVYTLRVSIDSIRYFTAPVEIQVNSEGSTNTLARDKIFDTEGSPLIGSGEGSGGGNVISTGVKTRRPRALGVVQGYTGTQVFNTTYATTDSSEPLHCGVRGGASYWLLYQPPTNGTITLDTSGSTYNTVMEAYTFNGTLTGYQDLISLACDNDGVSSNGASRVQFGVVNTRQYVIVVDGVNGARGIAYLNYKLNTNALPTPPNLLTLPSPTVAQEVGRPGLPGAKNPIRLLYDVCLSNDSRKGQG